MSGQVKVIARDVTPALKLLGGKSFDYIFMDPPYRKGYINEILKEILSCGICSDDAIIVAEHSVSEAPDLSLFEDSLDLWKEKKSGAIVVTYLRCRTTEGV